MWSRECLEETGVRIEPAAWQPLVRMHQPNVYELDFFFASSEAALSARTMETEQVAFPVANLPAELLPNLRWLIPLALDQGIEFSAPIATELLTEPTESSNPKAVLTQIAGGTDAK